MYNVFVLFWNNVSISFKYTVFHVIFQFIFTDDLNIISCTCAIYTVTLKTKDRIEEKETHQVCYCSAADVAGGDAAGAAIAVPVQGAVVAATLAPVLLRPPPVWDRRLS